MLREPSPGGVGVGRLRPLLGGVALIDPLLGGVRAVGRGAVQAQALLCRRVRHLKKGRAGLWTQTGPLGCGIAGREKLQLRNIVRRQGVVLVHQSGEGGGLVHRLPHTIGRRIQADVHPDHRLLRGGLRRPGQLRLIAVQPLRMGKTQPEQGEPFLRPLSLEAGVDPRCAQAEPQTVGLLLAQTHVKEAVQCGQILLR